MIIICYFVISITFNIVILPFQGVRRRRNLLSVFDVNDLKRGLGFGEFNVEEPEAGSLVK